MLSVAAKRSVALGAMLTTAVLVLVKPDALVAAWHGISELIDGHDHVTGGPPVMSQREIAKLSGMTPQEQAERLLDRATNQYVGATELIAGRVDGWRGHFDMTHALDERFTTAMSSSDLRVRTAAIEIYLAAYRIEKTPDSVARIMKRIDADPGARPHDLWTLGLLGNRGVEPERVLDYILNFVGATELETRHWAVEGLAVLGTDGTIAPLLRAFHDDPSGLVRERAARGLARSGMLTEAQRWTAIPELIRFTDDPKLDAQTQRWAFRALQDISGQRIENDAAAWRAWWESSPKRPDPASSAVAVALSPR